MKINDLLTELRFDPNTGKPIRDRVNDITSFVRAFKNLDAGAEPKSDVEWAVKLVMDGVDVKEFEKYKLSRDYGVPRDHEKSVYDLMRQTPSVSEMEQSIRDKEVTAQQNQQSDQLGSLQHNLNVQQLIRQNQIADADAQAMLQMDIEVRQAIKERQQAMELEAKERLAKVEIDVRNSKEPEAERAQSLEMAKQGHAHELEVIKITAEGEYKKSKLEADYQIQIKQLDNIDNAGERQSRLDVINTEKQKELAIIDKETQTTIEKMQAGVDVSRQESDIRIREEFMQAFKPVWSNLLDKASQVGKTVGQNISAVMGALGRLSKPVMPKAQQPAESIAYFRDLVAEMDTPRDTPQNDTSKIDPDTKCNTCGVPYKNHFRFDANGKITSTTVRHMTMKNDFPGMAGMDPFGSKPKPSLGADRVLRQRMASKK
jgi:hypothetical protein